MEDYALRFTPRSFRKWSALRVANTAFGAASFLVLEAVGVTSASLTLRSLKQGFASRAKKLRAEHKAIAPKLLHQLELAAGREPSRLPESIAVGDELPSAD